MLMKLPHLQGANLYSLKLGLSHTVIPRPALGTMGRTGRKGSKILREIRDEPKKKVKGRIFLFANRTAKLILLTSEILAFAREMLSYTFDN